jgi:hypothetical protein
MGGFGVTPDELLSAASTLRAVQGALSTTAAGAGTGGDLGSPALEGSLAELTAKVARVNQALDGAVVAAALNAEAASAAYSETDRSQMGGGR